MYSVALPRLVALNFMLEIKVQHPVGIPMVPTVQTLFLIVRQCYWIGGLREITGPSTVVLEKKMDVETKKAEVELSMLQLQQKEQLLLAWKRLLDAGVSVSEVDLMLPIK